MTSVSSIIYQGLRENNAIAIGASPTTPETNECLTRLQSLCLSVFGNEVGENLNPWPLGNYGRSTESRFVVSEQFLTYPQINSMLIAVNEEPQTVYLPVNPSDGARIGMVDPLSRLPTVPVTLNANGRAVEGLQTLVLDNTIYNGTIWFYRADLGNWVRVTNFSSTGEFPFPREFDDYFVIMLAMRLNPAYGLSMDPQSVQRLKQIRTQLIARYVQSAPLQINPDISFPTLQSYNNFADSWFGNGDTGYFNRGGYWGGWGPV